MSSLRDLLDVPSLDNLPVQTAWVQEHISIYSEETTVGSMVQVITMTGTDTDGVCLTNVFVASNGNLGRRWQWFRYMLLLYCMVWTLGQYMSCTLCAEDMGVSQLDGCCYDICVASGTCRHPSRGGFDGCKSYVSGPGLSDFSVLVVDVTDSTAVTGLTPTLHVEPERTRSVLHVTDGRMITILQIMVKSIEGVNKKVSSSGVT